jgi:hypothetical protein
VLQDVDKSLFPRNPTRDQLKVIDGTVLVDDIYTAEKILGHKGPANKRFFLVKWQGYPASENTWEPEENLLTCQGLLDNYWSVRNAAQESEVKNAESENPLWKLLLMHLTRLFSLSLLLLCPLHAREEIAMFPRSLEIRLFIFHFTVFIFIHSDGG